MPDDEDGVPAEMFPNKIWVSANVFVHPYPGADYHKVWFNVGVQYFPVGPEMETLDEARRYAEMLVGALDKFADAQSEGA